MLNVKEVKLLQMREIAEQGKQLTSLNPKELNRLNDRLDTLAAQVSAIDSDSKMNKRWKKIRMSISGYIISYWCSFCFSNLSYSLF